MTENRKSIGWALPTLQDCVYNPDGWREKQRLAAKFKLRNWNTNNGYAVNKSNLEAIYNYYGDVYNKGVTSAPGQVGKGRMEWAGLAKVAGSSVLFTDKRLDNPFQMLMTVGAIYAWRPTRTAIVKQGLQPVVASLVGPITSMAGYNPQAVIANTQLISANVAAMLTNSSAALVDFLNTSFRIFNDVGWQLQAYQTAGFDEMDRIGKLDLPNFPGHVAKAAGRARVDLVDAWKLMNSAAPSLNRLGNKMLIEHEQLVVAQKDFDRLAGPPGSPRWMINPGGCQHFR